MSLISVKNGKPIRMTSASDRRGYGLGVMQLTDTLKGTTWFYEGASMGYRMMYVYYPRQDAVVAFALNSMPGAEDKVAILSDAVYKALHGAGRL
jgi:D-alanyl-D-alanine carboxypeptidase